MDFESFTPMPNMEETSRERVQSSLRMKYAAEVQLIIHKWGRLEDMRKTLGLSQRKICQLLLVDPSAWTRWTRNADADEAPPHIFRALSWYLLLLDKNPELSPYVFLQTVARPQIPAPEIKKVTAQISESLRETFANNQNRNNNLILDEIEQLKRANKALKTGLYILSSGLFLLGIALWLSRN